jgi:hypothetical protein
MTGTEWQSYGTATSLASGDTLLARVVAATPPSAGTVEQVTSANAAASFAALQGWYCPGLAGATGSNTSGDTTVIQAMLNAMPAGSVILFDKLYTVNAVIEFPGGLTYLGINQATGLRMADSANLNALAAPVGWAGNTATEASQPVTIRDMAFFGPPSVPQASGDGHLLVMNNFWSYVEDCQFGYNTGAGIRFDACTANGTQIISGGGAVQNRVRDCQFYQCAGGSVASNDPSGAFTDGFIVDSIFEGAAGANPAIGLATLAGWKIDGNHFFGFDDSVIAGRPYETRVVNNYFEAWGDDATADYYSAIDFGSGFVADEGAGTVISGNTFNAGDAGNAGSTLIAVAFAAASGQQGTVAITGNQFSGPTGTVTGTFYGITLNGQSSTSTVVATVSGNSYSGTWNGAELLLSNEDSSATTNFQVTGDLNAQRVALPATFSSGAGTSAQNVTGMAAVLTPGTYLLKGRFWYTAHGTTGSTQTFAFTFGGTASSAQVTWQFKTAAYTAPVSGTTVTTSSGLSPTLTTTTYPLDFEARIAVSAAGTLQLTVTSTTGGDEVSVLAGSNLSVQPVAA